MPGPLRMLLRAPARSLTLLLVLIFGFWAQDFVISMNLGLTRAVLSLEDNYYTLAYARDDAKDKPRDWQRPGSGHSQSLQEQALATGLLRAGLKQPAQMLSAYAPQLQPILSRSFDPLDGDDRFDSPYNYAALSVTILEIQEEEQTYFYTPPVESDDYGMYEATLTYYVITAKVEEVIRLRPEFTAPDEMQMYATMDQAEGGGTFEVGKRYFVAGKFMGVIPRNDMDVLSAPKADDVRKTGWYIDPDDKPTFEVGAIIRDFFTPEGEFLYDAYSARPLC